MGGGRWMFQPTDVSAWTFRPRTFRRMADNGVCWQEQRQSPRSSGKGNDHHIAGPRNVQMECAKGNIGCRLKVNLIYSSSISVHGVLYSTLLKHNGTSVCKHI